MGEYAAFVAQSKRMETMFNEESKAKKGKEISHDSLVKILQSEGLVILSPPLHYKPSILAH
jgi:hypothetical protein